MSVQQPPVTSYRVEISGWDSFENFFVEKTTLEWAGETEKLVYLRHPLREGAVVFVRLIDSAINTTTFPIAYQAGAIRDVDIQGLRQITLVQMRPNSSSSHAHGPSLKESEPRRF